MHPYQLLPMNYVGFALAAWLIGFHLWMILKKEQSQKFLTALPRNYAWGAVLMAIAMLWVWILIIPGEKPSFYNYLSMPLGDFNPLKVYLVIGVPVAAYLVITQVKEFLAVRAIGLLLLLAAAPILYCCFQDWPTGKHLLSVYAYVMILAGGMFMAKPYLFRDLVDKAKKSNALWLGGAVLGILYGVAVLICSIMFWSGY